MALVLVSPFCFLLGAFLSLTGGDAGVDTCWPEKSAASRPIWVLCFTITTS